MNKLIIRILVCLFCITSFTFAQRIDTDRPGRSDSPFNLPSGRLQLENGIFLNTTSQQNIESLTSGFGSLLRYGINDDFEIKLGGSYQVTHKDVEGRENDEIGFTPVNIGIKTNLTKEKGWIPHSSLSLNVGLPQLATYGNVDAIRTTSNFLFNMTNSLGNDWALVYSLGGIYSGDEPSLNGIYSIAIGNLITDDIFIFGEFYSESESGIFNQHFADAGIQYYLNDSSILDIWVINQINSDDNNWYFTLGYSLVLD